MPDTAGAAVLRLPVVYNIDLAAAAEKFRDLVFNLCPDARFFMRAGPGSRLAHSASPTPGVRQICTRAVSEKILVGEHFVTGLVSLTGIQSGGWQNGLPELL